MWRQRLGCVMPRSKFAAVRCLWCAYGQFTFSIIVWAVYRTIDHPRRFAAASQHPRTYLGGAGRGSQFGVR